MQKKTDYDTYAFCSYAFANPWVQAMLLESSLLDPIKLLDYAQQGYDIREANSIAAYKRMISSLREHQRGRLPAEIYPFGYSETDYQQHRFELNLIATMRAGFCVGNPFFLQRQGLVPDFQDPTLEEIASTDSKFLTQHLSFVHLKAIVDFHLKKSYQFGLVCVRRDGMPADYASVHPTLPPHPYASTFVCINQALYYVDNEVKTLTQVFDPTLPTLMQDQDILYSSYDECAALLSCVPGIAALKDELDRVEIQFKQQLDRSQAQLVSLTQHELPAWTATFQQAYLNYQQAINRIFPDSYPLDYLQDVKIFDFAEQNIHVPTCFAKEALPELAQAKLMKLHICNLTIALAQSTTDEAKLASFRLSENLPEGEDLNQSALMELLRSRCQQFFGELQIPCDFSRNPLELLTVFNVIHGQMQRHKQELIHSLEDNQIELPSVDDNIKQFERETIKALKPMIEYYLSGKMADNKAFFEAAQGFNLPQIYERGKRLREVSKQYFDFKTESQKLQAQVRALSAYRRQFLVYGLLGFGLLLGALVTSFSFGALLPVVLGGLGLGLTAWSMHRSRGVRRALNPLSAHMNQITTQMEQAWHKLYGLEKDTRDLEQSIQHCVNHLLPALQVWPQSSVAPNLDQDKGKQSFGLLFRAPTAPTDDREKSPASSPAFRS